MDDLLEELRADAVVYLQGFPSGDGRRDICASSDPGAPVWRWQTVVQHCTGANVWNIEAELRAKGRFKADLVRWI